MKDGDASLKGDGVLQTLVCVLDRVSTDGIWGVNGISSYKCGIERVSSEEGSLSCRALLNSNYV